MHFIRILDVTKMLCLDVAYTVYTVVLRSNISRGIKAVNKGLTQLV